MYLKDYMKKVITYLEENNRTAEVDAFKTNINKVMKELLGKFKDLQFYTGNYFKLFFTKCSIPSAVLRIRSNVFGSGFYLKGLFNVELNIFFAIF